MIRTTPEHIVHRDQSPRVKVSSNFLGASPRGLVEENISHGRVKNEPGYRLCRIGFGAFRFAANEEGKSINLSLTIMDHIDTRAINSSNIFEVAPLLWTRENCLREGMFWFDSSNSDAQPGCHECPEGCSCVGDGRCNPKKVTVVDVLFNY